MVTENHYRWDFIGLSTDEKPTPATSEKVVDGSTYYTSDDSKLYVFCKDQWYEKIPIGGGGGGGGDEPAGDGVITAYNSETGEITGTGFGSTAGKVYMLDRDTHSYIEQDVKSWTSTKITLTTPLDLEHLEGTTSIVALLDNDTYSTKLLVTGDITVTGWGKVYFMGNDGEIDTVSMTSQSDYQKLRFNAVDTVTIGGKTFYCTDIVGLQFGSSFNLTQILNNYLDYCYNLNQPVVFPDSVTDMGNPQILYSCTSLNQPVVLPKNLLSLGQNFMTHCTSFNQKIVLPDTITSISNNFMQECFSYNQPITIPASVTSLGNNFMYKCHSFNSPIEIKSTCDIGSNFLTLCHSFNQPITIPDGVTAIGTNFLGGDYTFNQPITLSNTLSSIGGSFGASSSSDGLYSFNQPLTLPSSLRTIGERFLQFASSFNYPLVIPEGVTYIGKNFMQYAYGFSSKLTVPSTVSNVGTYFMQSCYGLTEVETNTSTSPTDDYSLSTTASASKMYVVGITLTGSGATAWKTALADSTSSPYRKLIDGTAE